MVVNLESPFLKYKVNSASSKHNTIIKCSVHVFIIVIDVVFYFLVLLIGYPDKFIELLTTTRCQYHHCFQHPIAIL